MSNTSQICTMRSWLIFIYEIQLIKKSKKPWILIILILKSFADCNMEMNALNKSSLTKVDLSPEKLFESKWFI